MNPTAIYSKSGKGVQEAAGKTSLLQRADRAVLAAIDGRATLAEVAQKCGKSFDAAFQQVITQLDKNGFVREISGGAGPTAAPAKPAAAAAPKPAAKPAAKPAGEQSFGDLDFSSLGTPSRTNPPVAAKPAAAPTPAPPPKPAPPPMETTTALNKAREEAEARAQAERDRIKKEAEAKTRAEMEAKLRAEAEKKMKEEAEARAQADADAKIKAAREAAVRAAAEAKAKAEADAKAKLEIERKAREEAERKAKEADELKQRLEAERKAREEAERKAKEADELKQRLEAERKAREAAERNAREEAERVRKEAEEKARRELEEERKRLEAERKKEEEERAARRKREEEEAAARRKQKEEEEQKAEAERAAKRKQREDEERKAEEERAAKKKRREEEEAAREREEQAQREERAAKKKQREEEEAAREAQEEAEREAARTAKRKQREEEEAAQASAAAAKAAAKAAVPPPAPAAAPKAPAKTDSFADSLLADLDNFTSKDEEDAKAQQETDRKAKAEAERHARDETERQAKEEAERRRREEEESRRREEEARRSREEEERRAQEEERRKREADEIRRKAEAATAAAMAKEGRKVAPAAAEDIPISDDDLDMDEVKKEQAALAKAQAKEKEKEAKQEKTKPPKSRPVEVEAPSKPRRPAKWGRPVAMTLVALLVVGLVAANFVPLGTADYERAATEALARPVKIGAANLWLFAGLPQVRFKDVRIGDARITQINATGMPGGLLGEKKDFSNIEVDGFSLPQPAIADAIFAKVRADNFSVSRITIKNLELPGPATLPKNLEAEIAFNANGALRAATVRGPDGLVAKLVPKGEDIEFDVIAGGFTLPIAPQVTLSKFAMKGTATPRDMTITEWGGAIFNGGISGTANISWQRGWSVDGVVTVRNINAAVFAPALLSAGNAEGTAKFSMSGADPAALVSGSRLDGNFTVSQGTLGSFDLARAIQSNGKFAAGTTPFAEMNGQATYDRGTVALRNVTIGAGALNAGASAEISQSGALSGRIVADMKTASQIQRATLLLGGTVKEPQVRN